MADRSLQGRRIVVTRPREQAGQLVEGLERLGAGVSAVPLVEIRAQEDGGELDAAVAGLRRYDWVVFTSANAVAAVGGRLRGALDAVLVAAVGPATAEALRRLGVEPAFVPERFAASEIAGGLGSLRGARVLLPQSDLADPRLASELRARGATVDVVVAYRTVETTPDSSGLAALRAADAIVLASPSAARSLAALGPPADSARRPLLVAIGLTTATAARELGLAVGLVAHEASADGIIQALRQHFGVSP